MALFIGNLEILLVNASIFIKLPIEILFGAILYMFGLYVFGAFKDFDLAKIKQRLNKSRLNNWFFGKNHGMNKTDLIKFLAKRCDLSLVKSRQVVENMLDLMVLALKRGEVITLKGFGKFWANYSKSCLKYVPNSLNKVLVPAKFLEQIEKYAILNLTLQKGEFSNEQTRIYRCSGWTGKLV